MGKTRGLVKKIGDAEGTFHAKMGTIKDRNGKELTEAEEINKRQQEYTEELYKKGLKDPDNHDAVVTHLDSDTSECEVRWNLGNIITNIASRGDRIPNWLFKTLYDNAVKCCTKSVRNLKTEPQTQDWNQSVFISVSKKGNAKVCSNYHKISFIAHASKIMLKILQDRLQ